MPTSFQRRQFLCSIGAGALWAGLGPGLSRDLGVHTCHADQPTHRLTFGKRERLVSLIQETPIDRFLPAIVKEYRAGTSLEDLVAATALANTRCFGGEDYIGFHSLMALPPAYHLARQGNSIDLVPLLKVMYRNARQMQARQDKDDVLSPIEHPSATPLTDIGIRDAVRQQSQQEAEQSLSAIAAANPTQGFEALQATIQDDINVHRVVLAWRCWELLPFTGLDQAQTMLRQSIHFGVDSERDRINHQQPEPAVRAATVKLVDQYHLASIKPGTRQGDEAWIANLANSIHRGTRESAAEAVAGSLADGFSFESISQALALAANRLLLCDPGLAAKYDSPEMPAGSVHGASVGVHASDAANAWNHIARTCSSTSAILSLVVGAYHTGGQASGGELYPLAVDRDSVANLPVDQLLAQTDEAIRARDQRRTAALIDRYSTTDRPVDELWSLLRRYAISEDGSLHAEKYYHTAREEFHSARPAHRWGQLIALGRVSASQFGRPAPGLEEARQLLAKS
jgi:hypothetical protein